MTIYQSFKVNEDLWGEVNGKIVLSDSYNGLFTSGVETRGLVLRRIQRSLASDGLKVNTILEIDYYDDNVSSVERSTLELLKSQCFIMVEIDSEVMYIGKLNADFEIQILSMKDYEVSLYKFQSQPVTAGMLSEIKVQEVIDVFTDNDWNELINWRYFGVGDTREGTWQRFKGYLWRKDFLGNWSPQLVEAYGGVANLMNLNAFLNKFCLRFSNVVQNKYGANLTLRINTIQLPGWFYPRYFQVNWMYLATYDIDKLENRKVIYLSSEDTSDDTAFFVDAGFVNYQFKNYRMEKIWTGDSGARANEHRNFLKERILSLSVEQFLHRLGANFGLLTTISTNNDVDYIVNYIIPSSENVSPFEVHNVRRPMIRMRTNEKQKTYYTVHFTYIEDDDWDEFRLDTIRKVDVELEAKSNKDIIGTNEGEKIPLFFGFFPKVVVDNNTGLKYAPNTFLVMRKFMPLKEWTERENVMFNRMLWVKVNSKRTGADVWEPYPCWLPVKCWQTEEYISSGSWWERFTDYLRKTKFWLMQAVNDKISKEVTKELDLELGGFYKIEKNGVFKWQFAEVGNYIRFRNEIWQINEVEFDFNNWIVKIRAVG